MPTQQSSSSTSFDAENFITYYSDIESSNISSETSIPVTSSKSETLKTTLRTTKSTFVIKCIFNYKAPGICRCNI